MFNNIINLDINKAKYILKNKKIRKELLKEDNINGLIWLIYSLDEIKLSYLLDDDFMLLLKNNSRVVDIYIAIIRCGNNYASIFLTKEDNLNIIFKHINILKKYIRSLDNNFAIHYFNYMIRNNINITCFKYLNSDAQISLLKNKEVLDIIKSKNLENSFLKELSPEAINYLLDDKYFQNMFLNYNVDDINSLVIKGLVIPIYLQDNSILINKYLNIDNIDTYHIYTNNLAKSNSFLYQNVKRKAVIKYSKNLEEKNNVDIFKILVTIIYEDLASNFLLNLDRMLDLILQIDIELIPKKRLRIYSKLIKFSALKKEELIDIYYHLLQKTNTQMEFYDDYKACFNYANKLLKNSCYDCTKHKPTKIVDGVDVYFIEDEIFYLLISHTPYSRDEENNCFTWKKIFNSISCSLISNELLKTYDDPNRYVILGFNNFDINNIIHMCVMDSNSSKLYGSNHVIDLNTPLNFVRKTFLYNEILIKQNNDLYPDYVVCFDEIKPGDLNFSKILNIPIVLINTKKCNLYKNVSMGYEDKYYLTSLENIINKVEKRRSLCQK